MADIDVKQQKGASEPRRSRLMTPLEDMERFYESLFPSGWLRPFRERFPIFGKNAPAVDVIDKDDRIIVRAQVPGVKKQDLEVSISDHSVTIRGCTKREEKEENKEYYYHEINEGEFSRTVALPEAVDTDRASAKMKDGVLEVALPKSDNAKRKPLKIETE